ncbi:hypothetical protein [Rhodovulum sulfidophilum]|uniref:hypothetical protein n=1 Tax=Rhodovulum sulfidophilum TaxID=35806 RepID=UPI001F250E41|nr:hypothetical protein [Rhodovulum sulfidophilum]MCE8439084.1 hypothetical protein [Rhodovulum sulfidophilum]
MRALPVLGVIEIRPGGGACVSALDASSLLSQLNVFLGLFEISVDQLCQARRLIGGDLAARQAKAADPLFLARAAQSLNVPGLEFRKAAIHTDGMPRRSIADHGRPYGTGPDLTPRHKPDPARKRIFPNDWSPGMSRRPVVETDDIFPERTVAELSGAEFLAHQSQDPADVAKAIRGADMAVVQFAPDDDAEVITGMAEGGALIRYGIGFGNIDVTAANDRGLPASHMPSCGIDEVAGPSVSALLRKPPALAPSARAGGGDRALCHLARAARADRFPAEQPGQGQHRHQAACE